MVYIYIDNKEMSSTVIGVISFSDMFARMNVNINIYFHLEDISLNVPR